MLFYTRQKFPLAYLLIDNTMKNFVQSIYSW